MATDATEQPSEDKTEADVQPCPVCGATGGFIHLDDGTDYCPAHKGLKAIVATPDVATVVAPPPVVDDGINDLYYGPDAEKPDDDDDLMPWPMEPGVRMVAGLALDAALATFRADGTFTDPPLGWAPPPADQSPHMEAGVALALGTLIEATECDRDVIQALADVLCGRTPTTEETSND